MRVLHVTRDYPPRTTGGISTAVGGLVEALGELDVTCATVSFDSWRPKRRGSDGPATAVVGPRAVCRLSSPSQLATASQFATEFTPTIVHVHHAMLWPFARQVANQCDAKMVLGVHVAQAVQSRLRGIDAETQSLTAQRAAVVDADLVVAPSAAAAHAITEDVPGHSRVEIVGLGITDTAFARAASQEERDETLAIYVGRFADINGTRELIEIIPEILERAPEARFAVAGGLPDNPKAERKWLRTIDSMIPDDLEDRVDILGWLNRDSLADLYRRAAVLVVPSWYETFALVALEGMLHGCAIACTNGGALAELVEHNVTGLVSAVGDQEALTGNVVSLLKDRPLRRSMAHRAARDARTTRKWSSQVGTLLDLYRTL